ncbi:MAG: hypothetical protein QXU31_06740 [Archaeoglobaceae archaeon]
MSEYDTDIGITSPTLYSAPAGGSTKLTLGGGSGHVGVVVGGGVGWTVGGGVGAGPDGDPTENTTASEDCMSFALANATKL